MAEIREFKMKQASLALALILSTATVAKNSTRSPTVKWLMLKRLMRTSLSLKIGLNLLRAMKLDLSYFPHLAGTI